MITRDMYIDKLTGLPNFVSFFREDFNTVFDSQGHMLLLKVKPLKILNVKYGREKSDVLIKKLGKYLKRTISNKCYRHEGNGFLIVYKNMSDQLLRKHTQEIKLIFNGIIEKEKIDEARLFTFVMPYNKPILSVADYYKLFYKVYMAEYAFEDESELLHHILQKLSNQINDMIDENTKVREFAFNDEISNLPNAKSATFYLEELESRSKQYAIMFIDGDHLRKFNEKSYSFGNKAIRIIADTIKNSIRKTDKVFRWLSGDEFIVVAKDIEHDEISNLAERIRKNVETRFLDFEIQATVSIGISRFPEDAIDVESALSNAELANKHAKKMGRNRYIYYNYDLINNTIY